MLCDYPMSQCESDAVAFLFSSEEGDEDALKI
jgi:hypothetical protein